MVARLQHTGSHVTLTMSHVTLSHVNLTGVHVAVLPHTPGGGKAASGEYQ